MHILSRTCSFFVQLFIVDRTITLIYAYIHANIVETVNQKEKSANWWKYPCNPFGFLWFPFIPFHAISFTIPNQTESMGLKFCLANYKQIISVMTCYWEKKWFLLLSIFEIEKFQPPNIKRQTWSLIEKLRS